jgi:hypothetical protein
MFTANIVDIGDTSFPQAWMAQKELAEHPSKYPGGFVKQDDFGDREWHIVREKDDRDYIND